MEKTYKRKPFNIELAKKIQSGEVEGRIVTSRGFRARLLATDLNGYYCLAVAYFEGQIEDVGTFDKNGNYWDEEFSYRNLFIELPEETPRHEFKIGDKVVIHPNSAHSEFVKRYCNQTGSIANIKGDKIYVIVIGTFQDFFSPDELELVKEQAKREFKPFDKVLVKSGDNTEWCAAIYSHYSPTDTFHYIASGCHWKYCIPYEGNEHLLGTTDKPKED